MNKSVKMTVLRVALLLLVLYFVTLFNGASLKDRTYKGNGRRLWILQFLMCVVL